MIVLVCKASYRGCMGELGHKFHAQLSCFWQKGKLWEQCRPTVWGKLIEDFFDCSVKCCTQGKDVAAMVVCVCLSVCVSITRRTPLSKLFNCNILSIPPCHYACVLKYTPMICTQVERLYQAEISRLDFSWREFDRAQWASWELSRDCHRYPPAHL